MNLKKLIIYAIVIVLLLLQFNLLNFCNVSNAVDTLATSEESRYYGKQLERDEKDKDAKMFYDVMVEMLNSGDFENGKDYDLVKNNKISQEKLQEYATGSQNLLYQMAAARDAFQYDYPEAFYLDFSAISFRVTLGSNGYHAYLGKGRRSDYFLPGFVASDKEATAGTIKVSEAKEKYDAAMEEALKQIVQTASEDSSNDVEKVKLAKAAHDYVTKHMIYRYEYQVENFGSTEKQYSNARTAYDCLIFGEGVCESYTRGYKAILDKLDIPCICVIGAYMVSDVQTEEHIWNYVQIEDKWYGVDVTHDDPIIKINGNQIVQSKESTKETRQYCLVGQNDLNAHHIPSKIFSSANYEFEYPELEQSSYAGEEFYNVGKFKVRAFGVDYVENATHSGWEKQDAPIKTEEVWVSYDNKNYTENVEENGQYILAKFAFLPSQESDELVYTDWAYIAPKNYDGIEEDSYFNEEIMGGHYLKFPMPHLKMVQFAVTDIPPKDKTAQEVLDGGYYYKGSLSLLTEKTPEIFNENDVYYAPPYIKSATPTQSVKLKFGETYDMTIQYDDELVAMDDQEPKLEITDVCGTNRKTKPSAIETSKLEDIDYSHLDEGKITFKFVPSDEFAANEVCYTISLKGVKGRRSGKAPIDAVWAVGSPCDAYVLKSQGIDWNIFGQPELMDTSSLDTNGWKGYDMSDGSDADFSQIGDLSKLTHRLSLVTTTTTPQENKDMLDILGQNDETKNDKILNSETYNIRLQLCKMQVVETGQSVRIRLGFPEGTTYEDYLTGAKEFKVYHYNYDEYGNITGVETIPVEVTRQGLILIVDSFSPFTIAAVEGDGIAPTEKKLVLSSTDGGTITYEGVETDTIDMNEHSEINVELKANEGMVIESIAVGSSTIPVTNNEEMTFTIKADELEVGTTRVCAKFMSKIVEEEDEERGETEVETPIMKYFIEEDEDGNKYISKIDTNTTIQEILSSVNSDYTNVKMLDNEGNEIEDMSKPVATGMKLAITRGTDTEFTEDDWIEYFDLVVYGDIDGDGELKTNDMLNWRRHKISDESLLTGAYAKACDYDGNGKITSYDILSMRRNYINSK